MKLIFRETHLINLWFYKIYCRKNNENIEETFEQQNIKKNIFDKNFIPTFSFNRLDYKIIKNTNLSNIAEILAGSYLIYVPNKSPLLTIILLHITKWSLINQVKTYYFINNYPDIIQFDGRLKNKSYYIAQKMNIRIPNLYLISNNINDILFYLNKNKLKEFVIKPNYGDTSHLVLINNLNDIDKYKSFPTYSQKELLPLLKKEDARIILQEYISNCKDVKLYIFSGKIQFIQVEKEMCSTSSFVYDKKSFLDAEFIHTRMINIPYLKNLSKDALKLYNFFRNYYNKDIFTLFLRVDFLVNENNYYFNEFSLLPNGGKGKGMTPKCDLYWGNLFFRTTSYISSNHS